MTFISQLFQIFVYQPLFNALILIYNFLPGRNLGLSVIILTAAIKLLTLPLNTKAFKLQKAMAKIQAELKEIQKKHRDNREEQARVMAAVFKREKVSPLGPLVPILVQLPILFALYRLFWKGLWAKDNHLYGFVIMPKTISSLFLGIDLSQPSAILAILAGVFQLFQTLTMPGVNKANKPGPGQNEKMSAMMQKQMTFFFPILTIFILFKLPSALGLYWLATSAFTVLQQYVLNKKTGQ